MAVRPFWWNAMTRLATKSASTTACAQATWACIFSSPPTEHIPGFSRAVFALVMRFMFDRLHAARVVVEPDVNNTKIHALNLSMGFVYAGLARFREKTASLAFCTRAQFEQAQRQELTQ